MATPASMYRLYEGSFGQNQIDIPPLEHIIDGTHVPRAGGRFVVALTIMQMLDCQTATKLIGLDPVARDDMSTDAYYGPGHMFFRGDHSVIPVIDGNPQYQGDPSVNEDWRIAYSLHPGDNLRGFREALQYLQERPTE